MPDVPTVTRTPGFSAMNRSAIASLNGATVLEPSMRIEPATSPPPPLALELSSSLLVPHAAIPSASTAAAPIAASHLERFSLSVSFSSFTWVTASQAGSPAPSQRTAPTLLPACVGPVKRV